MRTVKILCALAAVLWFVMFSPWTKGLVPFWPMMSATGAGLAACALFIDRNALEEIYQFKRQHVIAGLMSAAVLYLVFFIGNAIAEWMLPFAKEQVASIYVSRDAASFWMIGLLLFFVIGPAEEVFWRGFVQRRLSAGFGDNAGFFLATIIYAGVHIWSFNLMLVGAALVCGVFWGLMYGRFRSVWPGLISHALWDVAIFVLWPVK